MKHRNKSVFKAMTSLLLLLCHFAVAQDSAGVLHNSFIKIQTNPVLEQAQTVIAHDYYTIGYFEKYRIPLWTYYKGTKEQMLQCLLPRKGSFRRDPLVNLTQAGKEDYALPFEKGHLVPCEPMTFSEEAMKQTFYYTNCAPQYEKVNSGKWRSLEKLVNNWTIDALEIMVFTGNVVSEKSKRVGANGLTVPDYCFKIVLDYREPEIKAIAFLVPNKDQKLAALENYVKTIDEIEALTGFDFFADLAPEEQEKFEAVSDPALWDWKMAKYNYLFRPQKKNP
jgi:endonuclease G, mitochondrial